MGAAHGEPIRGRGPRPAARLARVIVVVLLVVAVVAVLVAITLAVDDRRTEQAPWARPAAPDVRPQPIGEQ
jgi:hypothetical protein